MRKCHLVVIAMLSAMLGTPTLLARQVAQPPMATKKPHQTRIHGYTLEDDYFWLREKSNPEVVTYLEAKTPTPRR